MGSCSGHARFSFVDDRDMEIALRREFNAAIRVCVGIDPDSHCVGSARELRSLQPTAQSAASLSARSNISRADPNSDTTEGMKILTSKHQS
jgi:hypothetical protein